ALPRPAAAFEVWAPAAAAAAAAPAGGRATAANGTAAEPRVQASGERLPDGRLRVCLRRYEPTLAGLPPVSARDRAAVQRIAAADATGLAFVDLWAVDPAWQPGKPFDCRWHAQRPHRGDRRLPLETTLPAEAVHGAHGTVAVQVVDC